MKEHIRQKGYQPAPAHRFAQDPPDGASRALLCVVDGAIFHFFTYK